MKFTNDIWKEKNTMTKRLPKLAIAGLTLALLSACAGTPEAQVELQKPGNIVASSIPTLATLAGIETNPHKYLDPQLNPDVLGAVEGQLTGVDYTRIDLTTDENSAVLGSLAQSVMTLRVTKSTFDVPEFITVSTSGGYLPTTTLGILGRPSGEFGESGVIEYETLGGSRPPVKGDQVILFVRVAGESVSSDATYTVAGASYGRFTLDPATNKFSRQMQFDEDDSLFEREDVVKAFN